MNNGVAMPTSPNPAEPIEVRSPITPLGVVLALIFIFFCGILIFAYIETKRINPVMLDQHGRPLESQSQPAQPSPPDGKAQQSAQSSSAH